MADDTSTDATTDTDTDDVTGPQVPPATGATDGLGDAGKQALDRMKAERNAASSRAKALEKELASVRQSQMSESEKAVAEAEARGRTAAAAEYGKRLARSQFDALAGRRNPDFDTSGTLEFADLSKFVGEDGEPDLKVIKAAVEKWVPEATKGPPSYDGGARTTATKPPNMNEVIRSLAGFGQ